MADPKQTNSAAEEEDVPLEPEPGDMADAAAKQMPGKPPDLTVDPGKRYDELARQSGDRALAEAEEERRKKTKK